MKFTHLHVHSHYSLLDGLPKIDELVNYVKESGMDSVALTDHGVLYGAVEFFKSAKKAGIKPIIGCLPPGHLIYTDKGMKPIEEIKNGDMVLTHKGRFRQVTRTMSRKHNGYIYGIKAKNANTVWVTEEHPILVSTKENKKTDWIRADSLEYGRCNKHGGLKSWKSYAVFPKLKEPPNNKINLLDYLNKEIYGTDGKFILKTGKYSKYDSLMFSEIPYEFNVNNNFAKLVGLFLAEGSFQHDPRGSATPAVFSYGGHEVELANFTTENLFTFTKCYPKTLYRPKKNLREVYLHSTILAQFLKNFCGRGSGQKQIPFSAYKWSHNFIESLLNGLALGDAKINEKTGQTQLKLKSKNLIWGVRLILATLGYPAKVSKVIDNGRVHYGISWTEKPKYRRVFQDENYLYLPIEKVDKKIYDGFVYNFEVEEDHSYVGDLTLHNCEVYQSLEGMTQKRPGVDDKRYHLVLLVKNEEGYKNLVKLVTKAHLEGFYYKPRVDEELLAQFSAGLIALSACLQGKIPRLILANRLEDAKKQTIKYQEIFGKENFYLELQHHANIPEQEKVNKALINFSKELNIPLVATCDSHYLRKTDAEVQDILMLINTGADANDPERLTMMHEDFSLRKPEEMIELFKETPEAIENTQKIAEMCNFQFELGKTKLPHFEVPDGKTPEDFLEDLCKKGLPIRYPDFIEDPRHSRDGENPNTKIIERLNYELSVIKQTGFAGYFLIVQDYVNWAKNNRIVVGPGRGSAGGSIVAYLTNTTNVDPIKHNLLFERFLNPERISMPDIDMDFTDRRRDEVINYISQKYGADHVAQIITFGTMAARAVIRDVGRALAIPYGFCDRIAKMIPQGMTLKETLEGVAEFKELYESDAQAKKLIDLGSQLEGVARHASTHACGIVISEKPLTEYVPLQHPTQDDDSIVTQYEMHAIEDLGLLKMDLLGLKNLTIIEDCLARIYGVHKISIQIDNIPADDEKTYKLFQEANTTGVFQLESDGIKRYLKDLRPTVFEDIVAMVALYRPGPMQFIPDFIKGKHGKRKIQYLHPKLEPILKSTYGICVYQEQLMQIAQHLAGFSLAEADVLRKAIGKKLKDLLISQEEKFVSGCIKNEIPKKTGEELWQWILPFAEYGFNKSHSVAYATIACQTAFLKAHYPAEFMAALLTSEKNDVERIAVLIKECQKMNLQVLPPDINESFRNFSVVPNEQKIRFGLLAIKNVGENIVEAIINERKLSGPYKSMYDFISRIQTKTLNKKSLESLIKAGAFDRLEERNKLLQNVEELLEANREIKQNLNSGQKSLFTSSASYNPSILKLKETDANIIPLAVQLNWEKELLGLYISAHPLDAYKTFLEKKSYPLSALSNDIVGKLVKIGGIISTIKRIITKNGKPMLFMNVEDLATRVEVVVFAGVLDKNPEVFQENKIVFVKGKVDNRDGEIKIIADEVDEIINQES